MSVVNFVPDAIKAATNLARSQPVLAQASRGFALSNQIANIGGSGREILDAIKGITQLGIG